LPPVFWLVLRPWRLLLARNSGYRSNSGYGGGRQSFWAKCDRWLRECNNGYDYSCEKYETRGCTE
jgi:hypothetical protein